MKSPAPTFAALVCLLGFARADAPWSGTGTETDPYLISTATDLRAIGANEDQWDKHFLLTANIDMAGAAISPTIGPGDTFHGDTGFSGVLDGGGFAIENFVSSRYGVVKLNTGTIRKLGVRNSSIGQTIPRSAGMIVAENSGGLIEDCYVDGGIVAGGFSAGGIVGQNDYGGRIYTCRSSCTVASAGGGELQFAGGIAGRNWSTIIASRSSATVKGDVHTGGIAGGNTGSIRSCYADGLAQGAAEFGGIAGMNTGSIFQCYSTATADPGVVAFGIAADQDPERGGSTASFWDTEATGIALDNAGATGLSTAEMQTAATFDNAGWELTDTPSPLWVVAEGGGYPHLWWELETPIPPDFAGGSGTIADPYQIATGAQWMMIGRRIDLLRAHYQITADIDFSTAPDASAGSIAAPFYGSLDGGGHTLANITITTANTYGGGLFASTTDATIHDLHLLDPVITTLGRYAGSLAGLTRNTEVYNVTVTNPIIDGQSDVGGLVGWHSGGSIRDCQIVGGVLTCVGGAGGLVGFLHRYTTVERCSASARIDGGDGSGGLLGEIHGLEIVITDCRATGDVAGESWAGGFAGSLGGVGLGVQPGRPYIARSSATGDVTGESYVGGFLGKGSGGPCQECFATGDVTASGEDVGGFLGGKYRGVPYTNCYALGDVTGQQRVGGFIGSYYPDGNQSNFHRCYAAGAVAGEDEVGGFLGVYQNTILAPITDSFWDMGASGTDDSAGGIGLWGGAMRSRTSFLEAGWDFDNTWTIASAEYPQLRWHTGGDLFDDTDGDGMSDTWEVQFVPAIAAFEPDGDLDGDGLTNAEEYRHGTRPDTEDSDGDGFTDAYEVAQFSNPNDPTNIPPVLTQHLTSDAPLLGEAFGHDVAISRGVIVIGAPGPVPGQQQNTRTTPPPPTDAIPGAAYIFRRIMTPEGPRWRQLHKLEPLPDSDDLGFGSSVDIDGDTVAIGCLNAAAYVFDLDKPDLPTRFDVSWDDPVVEFDPPKVPSAIEVAIHRDTLLIGSPTDNERGFEAGAAFLFQRDISGSWESSVKIFGTEPKPATRFGVAVALHGQTAAVGTGPYSGLSQQIYLRPGSVQIYRQELPAEEWIIEKEITQTMSVQFTLERFASELALDRATLAASGINGDNDGDYEPTAAALFGRNAGGIKDWGEMDAPDVNFDFIDNCYCYRGSFKLALRGTTLLIGTTCGTNVIERNPSDDEIWRIVRRFYPRTLPAAAESGGGPFGSAVDLSGRFIVAGAPVSESAWVTPLREPESYTQWVERHFGEPQIGVTDLSADPNRNGLNNELEFALGLDPNRLQTDEDFGPSISVATDSGRLAFTFCIAEPTPSVIYEVQVADHIDDWQLLASRDIDGEWTSDAEIVEHVAEDGRVCITVYDTATMAEGGSRFMRLGVRSE